jgi:peptidoglycan/xylan/chitin deacetylase (PgdA/CDA1 family)
MKCSRPSILIAAVVAACLVGAAVGHAAESGTPILVYHRFDPVLAGATTVRTAVFEQQLDWLEAHHYRIVPLETVVQRLRGEAAPDGPQLAAITVDDGHVSVFRYLYPIIVRRHVKVTLFIYPSAISNASYALTWEELREMAQSGLVTVQSHTFWHPNFHTERARLAPAAYRAFVDTQLVRSKAVLESKLGVKISMLAWPFGIVDDDLEAAAARAGYDGAFAYAGGVARAGGDRFAVARIPVPDTARGAAFAALLNSEQRTDRQK